MIAAQTLPEEAVPSRRESRRATEGLRIEKAALELFLARGISEVSIEDIARAAGISRRTFFRYFPSRDDILAATHVRANLRSIAAFRARPAGESLFEALLEMARSSPIDEEEAEVAELSRIVMDTFPEAWSQALARSQKRTADHLAEAVAFRLRQAGRSDAHALALAASLSAFSAQLYHDWVDDGRGESFAERLQSGLAALRGIVLADLER